MIKKFLLITIAFIILYLVLDYDLTMSHELAHVQTFKYFGCGNVTYEVTLGTVGFSGVTRCVNDTLTDHDQAYMIHSINEIVGYTTTSLLYAIVGSSYLMVVFLTRWRTK